MPGPVINLLENRFIAQGNSDGINDVLTALNPDHLQVEHFKPKNLAQFQDQLKEALTEELAKLFEILAQPLSHEDISKAFDSLLHINRLVVLYVGIEVDDDNLYVFKPPAIDTLTSDRACKFIQDCAPKSINEEQRMQLSVLRMHCSALNLCQETDLRMPSIIPTCELLEKSLVTPHFSTSLEGSLQRILADLDLSSNQESAQLSRIANQAALDARIFFLLVRVLPNNDRGLYHTKKKLDKEDTVDIDYVYQNTKWIWVIAEMLFRCAQIKTPKEPEQSYDERLWSFFGSISIALNQYMPHLLTEQGSYYLLMQSTLQQIAARANFDIYFQNPLLTPDNAVQIQIACLRKAILLLPDQPPKFLSLEQFAKNPRDEAFAASPFINSYHDLATCRARVEAPILTKSIQEKFDKIALLREQANENPYDLRRYLNQRKCPFFANQQKQLAELLKRLDNNPTSAECDQIKAEYEQLNNHERSFTKTLLPLIEKLEQLQNKLLSNLNYIYQKGGIELSFENLCKLSLKSKEDRQNEYTNLCSDNPRRKAKIIAIVETLVVLYDGLAKLDSIESIQALQEKLNNEISVQRESILNKMSLLRRIIPGTTVGNFDGYEDDLPSPK
jgi:hypothetical protein